MGRRRPEARIHHQRPHTTFSPVGERILHLAARGCRRYFCAGRGQNQCGVYGREDHGRAGGKRLFADSRAIGIGWRWHRRPAKSIWVLGRTRLFPKSLVMSIASPMAALYRVWAAGPLVAFILAIGIVALKSGGTRMPHEGYFYAYLLFLVSLFLHEFGHAAACYRFGQEPDEIGFTIYLIYPALYSNVTSAWRLGRWQRIVVDAGGIFFQSLVGSIYAILYWVTGWGAFRVAFLMILVSVVWSLNPLFKFDGYWALSDLMGIANLHKQVWVMFTHWLNRLRSRPAPTLPWPEKVAAVLLVYSVCAARPGYFFPGECCRQ